AHRPTESAKCSIFHSCNLARQQLMTGRSRPSPSSSLSGTKCLLPSILDPIRYLRPLLGREDRLRLGHCFLRVTAPLLELRPERPKQGTGIRVGARLLDLGANRVRY